MAKQLSTSMNEQFRRAVLLAVLVPAASLLVVTFREGVASASVEVIPGPSPLGALPANGVITSLDLTRLGYQASEFAVAGTAHSYHPAAGTPFERDGKWTVEPDPAPTPSFKTRFQVLAPADPSWFNGTVYVEWFNPGPGTDFAPTWYSTHV